MTADDPEDLTRPERSAAFREARRLLPKIEACGGCYCCLLRDHDSEGWGRATCGMKPPARFKSNRCTFRPDNERLAQLT